MYRTRVIPCLLLKDKGLVKTEKFKNPRYVGDPINAIKIFNDKEVDELIFLDITASAEEKGPSFELINDIATECFMPFCYGGAVRDLATIEKILKLGVEKVSINSYALENPGFIKEAARVFGSSTIVVSMDIKKNLFGGYHLFSKHLKQVPKTDPVAFAVQMAEYGAGELLINSVDADGTMEGYDLKLLKSITGKVNIPVIGCGGAGTVEHFDQAVKNGGVSAVAAGSMFVFYGKHKAVLITYPGSKMISRIGS